MTGTPLPTPIRILVKGGSPATWLSRPRGPRSDVAFPWVLQRHLLDAGRPVELSVHAMASERVASLLRSWESQVATFSPDVIVLQYGFVESIHVFLPRWLERHVRGMTDRPGAVRSRYRSWVVRPGWKLLATLQREVDRLVPVSWFSRRVRRVTAILDRYLERVELFGSPLVVVLGMGPITAPWTTYFPGMASRLEQMDDGLRLMLSGHDPSRVVYLDLAPLVQAFRDRGEEPVPDGGHFSPEFHRAVGQELCSVVEAWARRQPHLG